MHKGRAFLTLSRTQLAFYGVAVCTQEYAVVGGGLFLGKYYTLAVSSEWHTVILKLLFSKHPSDLLNTRQEKSEQQILK